MEVTHGLHENEISSGIVQPFEVKVRVLNIYQGIIAEWLPMGLLLPRNTDRKSQVAFLKIRAAVSSEVKSLAGPGLHYPSDLSC